MTQVEKIENALRKKFVDSNAEQFDVMFKESGHTITIRREFNRPYKSCGHWHGRSAHFVVTGKNIDGEKRYKSFETIAKAIVAGYLK